MKSESDSCTALCISQVQAFVDLLHQPRTARFNCKFRILDGGEKKAHDEAVRGIGKGERGALGTRVPERRRRTVPPESVRREVDHYAEPVLTCTLHDWVVRRRAGCFYERRNGV